MLAVNENPGHAAVASDALTTAEAAKIVGLAASTLEKKRVAGTGPIYVRYGRRCVRYLRPDLEAWRLAHRFESTSEY